MGWYQKWSGCHSGRDGIPSGCAKLHIGGVGRSLRFSRLCNFKSRAWFERNNPCWSDMAEAICLLEEWGQNRAWGSRIPGRIAAWSQHLEVEGLRATGQNISDQSSVNSRRPQQRSAIHCIAHCWRTSSVPRFHDFSLTCSSQRLAKLVARHIPGMRDFVRDQIRVLIRTVRFSSAHSTKSMIILLSQTPHIDKACLSLLTIPSIKAESSSSSEYSQFLISRQAPSSFSRHESQQTWWIRSASCK